MQEEEENLTEEDAVQGGGSQMWGEYEQNI